MSSTRLRFSINDTDLALSGTTIYFFKMAMPTICLKIFLQDTWHVQVACIQSVSSIVINHSLVWYLACVKLGPAETPRLVFVNVCHSQQGLTSRLNTMKSFVSFLPKRTECNTEELILWYELYPLFVRTITKMLFKKSYHTTLKLF